MYLKVMADAHGGEGNLEITKTLTGKESIKEILNIALALEKQSILFYIGLVDFISHKHGKDKVNAVIQEEKKHVAQLGDILNSI